MVAQNPTNYLRSVMGINYGLKHRMQDACYQYNTQVRGWSGKDTPVKSAMKGNEALSG